MEIQALNFQNHLRGTSVGKQFPSRPEDLSSIPGSHIHGGGWVRFLQYVYKVGLYLPHMLWDKRKERGQDGERGREGGKLGPLYQKKKSRKMSHKSNSIQTKIEKGCGGWKVLHQPRHQWTKQKGSNRKSYDCFFPLLNKKINIIVPFQGDGGAGGTNRTL